MKLVAIGRLSLNIGGRREVGLVAVGRLSLNFGGRRGEIVGRWEERLSLNIDGRREVGLGGSWEIVPKHWWKERGGIGGSWEMGGCPINIGGRRQVGLGRWEVVP